MRITQCSKDGWGHGQSTFELKNHETYLNGKKIAGFFSEVQFLKWFQIVSDKDYAYKANYVIDGTLTDEHLQIIAHASHHCDSCHLGTRELK